MKKSELRKLIKEEISKELNENYESLRKDAEDFMNENYSHLKIDLPPHEYNDVISALVEYKNKITRTPFGEGALMDQGGWDYNLMDQIEDKVEELNSIIGKYDNEEIINLINEIIRDLEQLKNK